MQHCCRATARLSSFVCRHAHWRSTSVRVTHCASSAQVSRFPKDTTVVLWTSVLPAPQASAAGVRTLGILKQLLTNCQGITSVHVVVPSLPKQPSSSTCEARAAMAETMERLQQQGVSFHAVPANREQDARDFLRNLPPHANLLCVFDRFFTEEMYSHHIHRHAPDATLVLDMQDWHSLRRIRQKAVQATTGGCLEEGITAALEAMPDANDGDLLRELASIYRMDLTLVCSPVEKRLLQTRYGISPHKLVLAPLLRNSFSSLDVTPSWKHRKDVCFVGGFQHDPNIDAVEQLMRLWPRIRKQLEEDGGSELPRLHIYGAFLTPALQQKWQAKLRHAARLSNPELVGISMDGFVADLSHSLLGHRLLLAPLRYGAGLKGKLVEAWQAGLPVVTTPIGAEGFCQRQMFQSFPGCVASSDKAFVRDVVELYTREAAWNQAHVRTKPSSDLAVFNSSVHESQDAWTKDADMTVCAKNWLDIDATWPRIAACISRAMERLPERRERDTTRAILWRESVRSTEYFSRYVEQKEMNSGK